MSESSSVRVVFYYSNVDSAIEAHSAGATRDTVSGIRKGAILVRDLFLNNLLKILPEVIPLTTVQMAVHLSDPALLKALVGKTVIVANPRQDDIKGFFASWQALPGASMVEFMEAAYDEYFALRVTSVSPSSAGD